MLSAHLVTGVLLVAASCHDATGIQVGVVRSVLVVGLHSVHLHSLHLELLLRMILHFHIVFHNFFIDLIYIYMKYFISITYKFEYHLNSPININSHSNSC